MKLPGYAIASLFVLGFVFSQAAGASIYAYTAADGSLSLSNVPVDPHYRILVDKEKKEKAGAPFPSESASPPSAIAGKVRYDQMVDEVARAHGLEGALLHAVISVESHYNPKAVSHKGASGLMQLMPATARRYGVSDAFDPAQNLHGGAKYLRDLLTLFNRDVSLALAAYNAGEHAVIRHGNRIPPFRETMNYVPRVLGYYRQYQGSY